MTLDKFHLYIGKVSSEVDSGKISVGLLSLLVEERLWVDLGRPPVPEILEDLLDKLVSFRFLEVLCESCVIRNFTVSSSHQEPVRHQDLGSPILSRAFVDPK